MNMKFPLSICAIIIAILFGSICAQKPENGQLISRTPYASAPYDAVKGLEGSWGREEYETALRDGRFAMETVKYSSDGIAVSALMYGPKVSGPKLPVIVFNRGGFVRGDIGHELLPLFYRFAKEGFLVISPMYRGSNGTEGKDEVGGPDLNDLMSATVLLQSFSQADTKNVFLFGESRGAMMVFQAIRDGFPANAAATYGGFSDFSLLVGSNPKVFDPLLKEIWSDYEAKKDEISRRRSAVLWPEKFNVPIFLMHGGSDRSVDPQQTLNLATQLQKIGKTYELIIYSGDNHSLSRNQQDRDQRVMAWFRKYIKK